MKFLRCSYLIMAVLLVANVLSVKAGSAEELKALDQKYIEAFNKQDAKALTSLYAEDAQVLPPASEVLRGKSAIEKYWRDEIAKEKSHQATEVLTAVSEGNIGYITGKWALTVNTKVTRGKYLIVCKKTGSDWKIVSEIWNEVQEGEKK